MMNHEIRMREVLDVVEGLGVGDALGESLSYRADEVRSRSDFSVFANGTVRYTDDTEMAIALLEVLGHTKTITENSAAFQFAHRFRNDPDRGYGKGARNLLSQIAAGVPWEEISPFAFGSGSFGNGAAMRAAPVGVYFSEDLEMVKEMAAKSARVTHYHSEGIAGAIAVAIACAVAFRSRGEEAEQVKSDIRKAVLGFTPEGKVRSGLQMAFSNQFGDHRELAKQVGNGSLISAMDTVPFCVSNACRCLDSFEEAFYSTVEVDGDCDTNAAIVCAIVTSFLGSEAIPAEWLRVREKLDTSFSTEPPYIDSQRLEDAP